MWTLMGVHMQTFISTVTERFPHGKSQGTLSHGLSSALLGTWTSHPTLYLKKQLNTEAQN